MIYTVAHPAAQKDDVSATCVEYEDARDLGSWDLICDLLGGTRAMRESSRKWLPQEPLEKEESYKNRLARSILYNAFKDTVDGLADRPFMKPLALNEEPPTRVGMTFDPTLPGGVDKTEFAREWMREAIKFGVAHALVDYPRLPEGATLADEKRVGNYPRLKILNTPSVFFWEVGGDNKLTEIRWMEVISVRNGVFTTKKVSCIWRITRRAWERWERPYGETQSEWRLVETTVNTLGIVPIVTLNLGNARDTVSMTADPPLLDLAWINLGHWQSYSDQRNGMRFARTGILFGAGFTEEEMKSPLPVGPTTLVRSNNPDAKLAFVEHTGSAMNVGFKDLESLEAKMEVMGLQPLVEKSAQQSATGKEIDEARSVGSLQSWVRQEETAFYNLLITCALWTKETISDTLKVDIFSDFGISRRVLADIEALLNARKNKDVSIKTFLTEFRRRGVISELTNIEEELATVTAERAEESANGEPKSGSADTKV